MLYLKYILLALLALILLYIAEEILFVIFFIICSLFINPKKESDKNNKFYRWLLNTGTGRICRWGRVKIKVTGEEKLPDPKNTRFVIVCNHRSNFDPMTAWYALRKYDISYISKPENFKIPFGGRIIKRCCFLPIIRGNPKMALPTIDKAISYLQNKEVSIGVYPEGTRSKSGKLLRFRDGVFKIPMTAKVPIVIATIEGSELIHKNFPLKSTKVNIDILEVLQPEDFADKKSVEISLYCRNVIAAKLGEPLLEERKTVEPEAEAAKEPTNA